VLKDHEQYAYAYSLRMSSTISNVKTQIFRSTMSLDDGASRVRRKMKCKITQLIPSVIISVTLYPMYRLTVFTGCYYTRSQEERYKWILLSPRTMENDCNHQSNYPTTFSQVLEHTSGSDKRHFYRLMYIPSIPLREPEPTGAQGISAGTQKGA
jgi:hypothetical protein